ncbi:tyrosine-type recombinase/integrase [Saccharomonospora glauca]|uniref:Site-specific recombinase XerD n=1 Tax=Saccharomonospora glauca K62 TaxID=928724 RepID=I1CXD4_9PSEU|nr:site-specific integrase [Saccharomonospora glauca]EIE97358.1 site-specific recombinase XerD [Saccharomonospora glauca K62]
MAVDDLWYHRARDPETGERRPTKRHGRGKRWRVRWIDPETGQTRTQLFDRRADAERHDANMRADISRGQYVDPRAGKLTVAEYAEHWRRTQLHRQSTAERTERVIRRHIVPVLGALPLAQVRSSHIRGWVKDRAERLAPSTLATVYHGTLVPLFNAAVADKRIGSTPCVGIRLPEVPDTRYYIAKPEQVHALAEALPERYRAIVYLAAGCGWRGGEIFGLERDAIDFERREIHVRQQLTVVSGRSPFLAPPKTKTSIRTNELPVVVAEALRHHLETFRSLPEEIDDETDPRRPIRRPADLVFTRGDGRPIHRSDWSFIWRPAVEKAGLPKGFGLRDLRHYFATVLIFGGANVKTVQLAMGHTTPTVTLNTYVGYWPDAVDQTRSLVDSALGCTGDVPGGTD